MEHVNPDYILAIRPDMLFYSHFIHHIEINKFNHGFRIGNHFWKNRNTHQTPKKNTRISDTIQWIPKTYFHIAHVFPGHEYYDIYPDMENNSIYISQMYSDTDSSKCQNPIYTLPQRPLSNIKYIDNLM